MATFAQISVNHALALQFQEDKAKKEQEVISSKAQMEKGNPPNQEAAEMWNRFLAEQLQRQVEAEAKLLASQEILQAICRHFECSYRQEARSSNGMRSTAEKRHEMYIPDDDPIELPKPYPSGNLSPFKPSVLGSNLRHIRKPNPPQLIL